MNRRLRSDPRQMLRSWYMGFFQIPWLPEFLLASNRHWLLRRVLLRTSRAGAFSRSQLQRYELAWSQTGALTGMLNWYRAGLRAVTNPRKQDAVIDAAVLIVWGKRDFALRYEMARQSAAFCTRARVEILEDATHWLHHEEAPRLQEMMLAFLNG